MKALLILPFVLCAGILPAQQTPPLDPWLSAKSGPQYNKYSIVFRPQEALEIHGPRYTLDGLSVEIIQAQNPFDLFNPFDPDIPAPAHDNITWDEHTGRAIGWNIFSLRF